MTDDVQQLKKRFAELGRRAFSRQSYTYTEFLTLHEQDVLLGMRFEQGTAPFTLHGGFEGAERRLAQFGSADLCGYEEKPPIACVFIKPVSAKFAEALTHRDFLGALMGLGLKRSVLGDIVLSDNAAYLFCVESVSGFIIENFTQVKRTTVTGALLEEVPVLLSRAPEAVNVNVASQRLDAVIAAVYRLSRSESQALFEQDKVFVNSRLTGSASLQPSPGDVVSVRGHGRFVYDGVAKETRKGRLFVTVRVY